MLTIDVWKLYITYGTKMIVALPYACAISLKCFFSRVVEDVAVQQTLCFEGNSDTM